MPAKLRLPGIWQAAIAIYVFSIVITPQTFSLEHVFNVFRVAPLVGIAAIGQTVVILAGGFDLSIAGVVNAANILLCALMAGENGNMAYAVAMCLLLGLVVGGVNGAIVSLVKIPPMIVTLAMNNILYGAALLYTKGMPKGSISPEFSQISRGNIFGMPINMIVLIALTVLFSVFLARTGPGQRIYAIGANPKAARLSGVNVNMTIVVSYMLSSLCAVLTAFVLTAYIGLPSFGIGDQYNMGSVTAVVIGGTLLTGGVGTVSGTMGGALFLTMLTSLTTMLNMSSGTQLAIQGAIIVIGVLISTRNAVIGGKRKRGKGSDGQGAAIEA